MLVATPVLGAPMAAMQDSAMQSTSMRVMHYASPVSMTHGTDRAGNSAMQAMPAHHQTPPCCGGPGSVACNCAALCAGVLPAFAVVLPMQPALFHFQPVAGTDAPTRLRVPPLRPPRA